MIQRDGHLFSVQSEVFEAPWGSFDSLARRRSQAKWPRGGLLIERDGHLCSGHSEVFEVLDAPWGSFDSLARRRTKRSGPVGVF